jgi:hypothetical protein
VSRGGADCRRDRSAVRGPLVSRLVARLVRYARSRGQVLGLAGCIAALFRAGLPELPAPSVEGLSGMLGSASGVDVRQGEFVWEPRGGAVAELVLGRPILYLGAKRDAPKDLYRARVRLTPLGQPVAVRAIENLTRTPDADEALLIGQGARAAFATVRGEQVLAVTMLEGLGGRRRARTDLLVDQRAGRAEVSLDAQRLTVNLGEDGLAFDLAQRRFITEPKGALRVVTRHDASPGLRLALVDAMRDLIGPHAVELGGRLVLFGKALGDRSLSLLVGGTKHEKAAPITHALLPPPPATGAEPAPAPLFHRSVIAPDGARGARVVLVRMDMRQLVLGVQAGSLTPPATAGVPGEGRLPEGARLRSRVVAVFNGGAETFRRHGAVADGRLLALPVPGLPSLRVTSGRELFLGPFPESGEIAPNLVALAQWERPLVGGDIDALPGDGSIRRRSALCSTERGDLVYAFAEGVDRPALSRALRTSGCVTAVPLAASPERLGFALARVPGTHGSFAPIDDAMDFDARATLDGSTRDFLYLSRRETTPEAPGLTFRPDGGTQPPPSWAPGIFAAETTLGGLAVRLVSFERGHLDYRLRAGPREIGARGEPWAGAFAEADTARALAALELGHATAANRYGLVLGTSVPLPVKPAFATLVIGELTSPRILLPGEAVTLVAGEQAVQLPLLADDRDITERARDRGAARARAALGVAEGGRIVVAFATHDSSDPLAVVLRTAGCRRVVELDRGSHHPAFLHRAGTPTPPRVDYESTTLWALSREMRPAVVLTE